MNRIVDLGTAVLLVAALFVLTRPGSQGADLVRALTGGFAQIVGTATGQSSVAAPARRGGGRPARGGRQPRRARARR